MAAAPPEGGTLVLPDTLQRVLPRTIPGPLSPQNKGAVHWGWQGYLAYGCQCTVVVVEPGTQQCVQALNGHTAHVTKVSWRNTEHYHQLSASYSLLLASGDASGQVRVWDVAAGNSSVLAAPHGGAKTVADLCWLTGGSEGREHHLLVLYPPHRVILWDARHQTKLWVKTYTHTLTSVCLDPFHDTKMAFLCENCVVFVNDLHPSKCPSSNGTKFYLASSGGSASPQGPSASPSLGGNGSRTITRRMREFVVGENKTKSEDVSGGGLCLQLSYHQSWPDGLLLLYPRELLVLDLSIKATVAVISLDRAASSFLQVHVLSLPLLPINLPVHLLAIVLLCALEVHLCVLTTYICLLEFCRGDGYLPCWSCFSYSSVGLLDCSCISAETLARLGLAELVYERRCLSDGLRLSKNNSPLGCALEPVCHNRIGLILGDGRVVFKEVLEMASPSFCQTKHTSELEVVDLISLNSAPPVVSGADQDADCQPDVSTASTTRVLHQDAHDPTAVPSLVLTEDHFARVADSSLLGAAPLSMPDPSITSLLQSSAKLRMLVTGVVPPLSAPPYVVRMCPPLTTRNLHRYQPRVAVGNSAGSLLLVSAATGAVLRELNVHTCPVRGIEWTSLDSVLSYAHQSLTSAQGQVRNELFHVDFCGGVSTQLRSAAHQESPITAVRVSYLKQYFLVSRKSDPLELWCCQTLSLLRTLPQRFPLPTALEWSPTSHVRKRRKKSDSNNENDGGRGIVSQAPPTTTTTTTNSAHLPPAGSDVRIAGQGGEITGLPDNADSNPISSGTSAAGATDADTLASLTVSKSTATTLVADTVSSSISGSILKSAMKPSATFPSAADLNTSMMTSSTSMGDLSSVERIVKETFMLSDSDGSLYHLSVEGNVIKDGVRVPPDPSVQRVTSIACKSHLMVLADSDSNLSLWDLNSRSSGHVNTGRGWIRRIRFAPGRDNLKLLVIFGDGADIWDMKEVKLVGRLKDDGGLRVVDGDWAASDRPLLATIDGCIRVMDTALQHCCTPMLHCCTEEPVGSPHLLPGEASLNLRTLLTHQPWRASYSLTFTQSDGFTPHQLTVIKNWLRQVPSELQQFLERCDSVAHRALLTALLFGDRSELRFWTVATHYLSLLASDGCDGGDAFDELVDPDDGGHSSAELISFAESSSLNCSAGKDAANNHNSSSNNTSNFSLNSAKTESDDSAVLVSTGDSGKPDCASSEPKQPGAASETKPSNSVLDTRLDSGTEVVSGKNNGVHKTNDSGLVRIGSTNVCASWRPLDMAYNLYCDSRHYKVSGSVLLSTPRLACCLAQLHVGLGICIV
ncbi:WD40-repeat-containing domain [Trinorchestia longiramus]|nr:WD40-repeat-containing domain [Trinorchestia longiramus]